MQPEHTVHTSMKFASSPNKPLSPFIEQFFIPNKPATLSPQFSLSPPPPRKHARRQRQPSKHRTRVPRAWNSEPSGACVWLVHKRVIQGAGGRGKKQIPSRVKRQRAEVKQSFVLPIIYMYCMCPIVFLFFGVDMVRFFFLFFLDGSFLWRRVNVVFSDWLRISADKVYIDWVQNVFFYWDNFLSNYKF